VTNCGATTKPCPCGKQVPVRVHHRTGHDHHYNDRRGVDQCLVDIIDAVTREGIVVETVSCNEGTVGEIGFADGRVLRVEFTEEWFTRGRSKTQSRRNRR
jgi:hypothetical protein